MSDKPCFKCGEKPAPYGYGLPGFNKDKPHGKRGYIWACADHRDEAEARRDKAIKIK